MHNLVARGRLGCSRWRCLVTGSRRNLLTQALLHGQIEPPLLEETVGANFARIVSQYGDRVAVISREQKRRLTYQQLHQESNILARGLQSLGVSKGDRVCVSLGNNVEFATLTYALFKLGAVLVPLNPAFNASQIISALSHLSATHLVIGTETNLPFKPPRSNLSILAALVTDLAQGHLQSEAVPSLKHIILHDNSSGRIDAKKLRATTSFCSISQDRDASDPHPASALSENDVVNIQFTSGTTSMPKAACLTHRSILNNGKQIGDRMRLTPEDIVCCPPPLFHCFGCILGYMATATHGSAIVFPSEAFNPTAVMKAVQEEKATALYGVPTMFLAELELISNGTIKHEGFEHLRTGIAAGSSIPAELMRKLHKILNLTELTICYGMTETSPVSFMTTTDDPLEKRINTVGRLLPHVSAKIVDPADYSKILPRNTRGELAVSGYLVMKEYWGQPEKTAEVMIADSEGTTWMHTGDEASMDDEGYVSITGRIKDLIIRGGENIHPLEIENCLLANPFVKEVSVVGLPDERYGEVAAAFVVCRDPSVFVPSSTSSSSSSPSLSSSSSSPPSSSRNSTTTSLPEAILAPESEAKKIQTWVRDRLSHHLVPKHIFFLAEYPKTASGKIQKYLLRDLGIKLLSSSSSSSSSSKKE